LAIHRPFQNLQRIGKYRKRWAATSHFLVISHTCITSNLQKKKKHNRNKTTGKSDEVEEEGHTCYEGKSSKVAMKVNREEWVCIFCQKAVEENVIF
jgi:hypothetical protein